MVVTVGGPLTFTVLGTVTVETIVDGTVTVTVCKGFVVSIVDGTVDGGGEPPEAGSPAGPLPGPPAGPLSGAPAGPLPGPPAGPLSGAPAGPLPGPPAGPLSGAPAGPLPGPPAGPFVGSAFGPLGVGATLVPAGAGFDGRPRVATSTKHPANTTERPATTRAINLRLLITSNNRALSTIRLCPRVDLATAPTQDAGRR
jgi:hypothetical protein